MQYYMHHYNFIASNYHFCLKLNGLVFLGNTEHKLVINVTNPLIGLVGARLPMCSTCARPTATIIGPDKTSNTKLDISVSRSQRLSILNMLKRDFVQCQWHDYLLLYHFCFKWNSFSYVLENNVVICYLFLYQYYVLFSFLEEILLDLWSTGNHNKLTFLWILENM